MQWMRGLDTSLPCLQSFIQFHSDPFTTKAFLTSDQLLLAYNGFSVGCLQAMYFLLGKKPKKCIFICASDTLVLLKKWLKFVKYFMKHFKKEFTMPIASAFHIVDFILNSSWFKENHFTMDNIFSFDMLPCLCQLAWQGNFFAWQHTVVPGVLLLRYAPPSFSGKLEPNCAPRTTWKDATSRSFISCPCWAFIHARHLPGSSLIAFAAQIQTCFVWFQHHLCATVCKVSLQRLRLGEGCCNVPVTQEGSLFFPF